MEKLKIGLFIDTWFPMIDGVINVVYNFALELSKVAEVTVFTCGTKKKDTKTYPFKVVRSTSVSLPFFDYVIPTINPKFLKDLKNSNLDIIHIHSPFMIGKTGMEYAKKHNIPVVGTIHSQYYQDFYRYTKSKWLSTNLLKSVVKVYNSCDDVFTVNEKMADVSEEYGFEKRPAIQNNGTNLPYVVNIKPTYELFEKKYGIKQNEIVLLFVGRINKIKNLEFTIDSLSALKQMGQKFKMLFVGSGSDTDELKTKVKKLDLENEVIFTGRVDDQELLYSYVRAQMFLFPSLYDTNSLVQIEAASQKTPSIFIRGSVTCATVKEDIDGFMSENDTKKFAEKIKEVLDNKTLYNKVSENAFNDLYVTWEKTVAKMYKKYIEIIERKKEEVKQEEVKQEELDKLNKKANKAKKKTKAKKKKSI